MQRDCFSCVKNSLLNIFGVIYLTILTLFSLKKESNYYSKYQLNNMWSKIWFQIKAENDIEGSKKVGDVHKFRSGRRG